MVFASLGMVLSLHCHLVLCARILAYVPTLSFSHITYTGRLSDSLVRSGHNVTMLLIELDANLKNNGSQLAQVRRYRINPRSVSIGDILWRNPGPFEDSSLLNPRILLKLSRVSTVFMDACRRQLADINFLKELMEERYDIGLLEQYDACGIGIFRAVGIKSIVWLSATAMHRPQASHFGINFPLSYVPDLLSTFNDRMTFMQRLNNVVTSQVSNFLQKMFHSLQLNLAVAYTRQHKNLKKELVHIRSIIVNSAPFLDFAAPTGRTVLFAPGLAMKARSNLPEIWHQFTAASSRGFMLVTFGSIAKTSDLDSEAKQTFLETLNSFPEVNFVVKYENITCPLYQLRQNIYLAKWIPQVDLMAHPSFLGMITHGGWSSILESVYYGHPMIIVPLFADQYRNARVIEQKQLGMVVDKFEINRRTLQRAVHEIITNNKYKRNSIRYSRMLKDIQSITSITHLVRRILETTPKTVHFEIRESGLICHIEYHIIPAVFIILILLSC